MRDVLLPLCPTASSPSRWPKFSSFCRLASSIVAILSAWLSTAEIAAEEVGIKAPAGFVVETFAGDDLAHDIFSMTLNARGEVVVAGLGYIKTLHDDDGDGRADRSSTFSELPASGAHGLCFDGHDLLCTGDNGLLRFTDATGDGKADGPPRLLASLRSPEHGANGVVQGPDGWFYVICGNDSGVTPRHASRISSPVKTPVCGALLRFPPSMVDSEIVAHGFRNPYDIDFHPLGHVFTVDADGERDQHLPWYSPTRLFDIGQGQHHGWVLQGWQRSWNRPASYFDNVPRLAELGRGSPTGLTVYRHTQFPERYRGSILSACWTLGRIYHIPLQPSGSSFEAKPEIFLETTGDVGFAPVDIAVGKSGELYVAIGGRRTRGSVFRVTYQGPQNSAPSSSPDNEAPIDKLLRSPQPLAAWSRAVWKSIAAELGRETLMARVADRTAPLEERIRGIEILTEMFGGLSLDEAVFLCKDHPLIEARAIWSLGRSARDSSATKLIASKAASKDPLVARTAWESLASLAAIHRTATNVLMTNDWHDAFVHDDRRVRSAALTADTRIDRPLEDQPLVELMRLAARNKLAVEHFALAAQCFIDLPQTGDKLIAARLMILSLGDLDLDPKTRDVIAGYSVAVDPNTLRVARIAFGKRIADSFPASDEELNRELARLLSVLVIDDEAVLERIAAHCTDISDVHDDLHYLMVMSHLPGARSPVATQQTAAAITRLHHKLRKNNLYISRNWPQRVGEALAALYARDPTLAAVVVSHKQFNLPQQAMLARAMPSSARNDAARKLIGVVKSSENEEHRWSAELIELAGTLPTDESLAVMREAWNHEELHDDIIPYLARSPQTEDRQRLIEGLNSIQPEIAEASAHALVMLGPYEDAAAWSAAVRVLRQACAVPPLKRLRSKLHVLLQTWTGKSLDILESNEANLLEVYQPWTDELVARFPEAATHLSPTSNQSSAAWNERLASIKLADGDSERGRLVFQRKSCLRCHAGNSPLGPDLAGAAARFSTSDLLAAIVDPNRDVSPLYQTTQLLTGSGRVLNGLVVYESPDATMLQTAPDTTVRIAGEEIVSLQKSRVSLMPTGLLDDASDRDIADLLAYLKTLAPRK